MYSLVALLSFLATAGFLHAFVFRRRGYLVLFSAALCAMLYTHTWAVFFVVACALALGVCLLTTDDRRGVARDGVIAFAAAGLGFLPWVPNLLYQTAHTGAPWAAIPGPKEPLVRPVILFGGWLAAFILFPVGALGVWHLVRWRRSQASIAYLVAATIFFGFILSAWINARINPGWSPRYFIAIAAPTVIVAGVALSRVGRLGLVALIVVAALGFKPWQFFRVEAGTDSLSNIKAASRIVGPKLQRGDVVIGLEPGQVTTLAYYLPPGMRYATCMGPVRDPGVIDWRDVVDRLETADTPRVIHDLIDSVPAGGHVVVAVPNFTRERNLTRYFELVNLRSAQVRNLVNRDPHLALMQVVPRSAVYPIGASAHLRVYLKTG
jgi:hypothetical protein